MIPRRFGGEGDGSWIPWKWCFAGVGMLTPSGPGQCGRFLALARWSVGASRGVLWAAGQRAAVLAAPHCVPVCPCVCLLPLRCWARRPGVGSVLPTAAPPVSRVCRLPLAPSPGPSARLAAPAAVIPGLLFTPLMTWWRLEASCFVRLSFD